VKLLLLLIPAAMWGQIGSPVLLNIQERANLTRTAEGLLVGIPLAQSYNITDSNTVMLTTAPSGTCSGGVAVNSHRLVTARWGGAPTDLTKPIRVILFSHLSPTIAGLATGHLCLADRGVAVDPGGTPQVTYTTDNSCGTNCKVFDTGAATFRIRSDYFNWFDSISIDGGATVVSSHPLVGGLSIVANGVTYTSAQVPGDGTVPYVVTVEEPTGNQTANESGENMRAQIKVTGALWSGINKKYRFEIRMILMAGETRFKTLPTITFSEDMSNPANWPTDISLSMPTALGANMTATYGTLYGTESTTQALAVTSSDNSSMVQYDHGNTYNASYVAPGEPGWRLTKNGTTQTTGNQSDGWLDLTDTVSTNAGIVLGMRENWQNYPMGVGQNGKTISMHMWPPDGDTNGDLTAIVTYKQQQALKGVTVGFSHIWPYATGGAMSFVPLVPFPLASVYTASNANPPVLAIQTNISNSGKGLNCGSVSASPPTGCIYWPAGQARQLYITSTEDNGSFPTPNWTKLNGFQTVTYQGVNDGSGNPTVTIPGFDSTNWGPVPISVSDGRPTPKVSTLIPVNDSNGDGVSKSWEIWGDVHAGAGTPGNSIARFRDRLFDVNPTYFSDTTWMFGRIHAQDSAADLVNCPVDGHFSRAECMLRAGWANFQTHQKAMNNFGSMIYGQYQYTEPGNVIAGIGSRYFAFARKGYAEGMGLEYARTGDPQYLRLLQAQVENYGDVSTQHVAADQIGQCTLGYPATKCYTDFNHTLVVKRPGAHYVTHGPMEWWSSYGGLTPQTIPAGSSAYDASEGTETNADEGTVAQEMDYLLTGNDLAKERLIERADQIIWETTGGTNTINESNTVYTQLAGRAFNGCMSAFTAALAVTGSSQYQAMLDACFAAGIQNKSNVFSLFYQNPAGNIPQQNPGNAVDYAYFGSGWNYSGWPEYAEISGAGKSVNPPTYSVGAPAALNVQSQLVKFGKMAASDVSSANQTGAYSWIYGFKPIAYAYHYSGDATLRTYLKRYFQYATNADDRPETTGCSTQNPGAGLSGAIPSTNCVIGGNVPDIHYFGPFSQGLPYAMYELVGAPTTQPDFPPVWFRIPTTGTLTFYSNKLTDTPSHISFLTDAKSDGGGDFEGDFHPKSGDITVDVRKPDGTEEPGFPITYKTPNQWWPVAAATGATSCLTAPDPPSITWDGVANNTDNRYQTITLPPDGTTSGTYTINFSVQNCPLPGYTTWHDVAIVANDLGNMDVLLTNNTVHPETGSYLYLNFTGATQFKGDINSGWNLTDPNGVVYKGGSNITLPLVSGMWGLMINPGWQDLAQYFTSFGGIKPLASMSPQTWTDVASVGLATYSTVVGGPAAPMTLTFGTVLCDFSNPNPLPPGQIAVAYSVALTLNGSCSAGTAYSITVGSLPPGLAINAGTGAITGTPVAPSGSYTFTAHEATNNVSHQYTIVIAPAALACMNTTPGTTLPNGQIGVPYSVQFTYTNCIPPNAWTNQSGTFPAGLLLGSTSGLFSGTPTNCGNFSFSIGLQDTVSPIDTDPYTLAVSCFAISSPLTLQNPQTAIPYPMVTWQTSGGVTPISYAVTSGTVPAGLVFLNGILLGTPTASPAPFTFTVTATDATGATATRTYTGNVTAKGTLWF